MTVALKYCPLSVSCVHYLVYPETFDDAELICRLWPGQADALDDPGHVSQIEQVMRLGGSGQQVLGGFLVHGHGAVDDLRGQSCKGLGESKPVDKVVDSVFWVN